MSSIKLAAANSKIQEPLLNDFLEKFYSRKTFYSTLVLHFHFAILLKDEEIWFATASNNLVNFF